MASVLVFPTPPPGAQTLQTSSTPNPESHSNTCSDEYLEPCLFVETLGGAKVNFTCHNKASHWHRGQVWQSTEKSLLLLVNMRSLVPLFHAKGVEIPWELWGGWLKRHTENHALGLLEKEEEKKIYGSGKEEHKICPTSG